MCSLATMKLGDIYGDFVGRFWYSFINIMNFYPLLDDIVEWIDDTYSGQ